MVRIEYGESPLYVRVRGHAGAAKGGCDPVCAGVSVLVLTLAENVKALEKAGMVRVRCLGLKRGGALIWVTPERKPEEAAQVFRTITTGLKMLGREFPEFVQCVETE